jgi:hypothetical protein
MYSVKYQISDHKQFGIYIGSQFWNQLYDQLEHPLARRIERQLYNRLVNQQWAEVRLSLLFGDIGVHHSHDDV